MPTQEELERRRQEARRKRQAKRERRERLKKMLKQVVGRIKGLGKRIGSLTEKIKRKKRQQKIVLSPGAPHWGGSDDILRLEVEPIAARAGFRPNSAKRSETYGNPGSDHHTSQTNASARDFPTANNFALRDAIARKVVGRTVQDYENVYFERAGARFRFQAIAGTHGTGPHLHIGIRRA